MQRYTFEEIKTLAIGDIFWARNDKYTVDSEPVYLSESNFYGDFSEKVEWTALSETSLRQCVFQVTNVRGVGNGSDPIIFKTATSEPQTSL